jgi:diguanylate cyclase (GGDEF)-like protein
MPPRQRATVSVGVACLAKEDGSLDDLLRRADTALYEAKQAGRDRVVFR